MLLFFLVQYKCLSIQARKKEKIKTDTYKYDWKLMPKFLSQHIVFIFQHSQWKSGTYMQYIRGNFSTLHVCTRPIRDSWTPAPDFGLPELWCHMARLRLITCSTGLSPLQKTLVVMYTIWNCTAVVDFCPVKLS